MIMGKIKVKQAFEANIKGRVCVCVKCNDTEFISDRFVVYKFSDFEESAFGSVIDIGEDFCSQMISYYLNLNKWKDISEKINTLSAKREAISRCMDNIQKEATKKQTEFRFAEAVRKKSGAVDGNSSFKIKSNDYINKVEIGAIIYKTERPIKWKNTAPDEYKEISKEQALDIILNQFPSEIKAKKDAIYITAIYCL